MALNIELFKKIRDRIAEIPESYNQNKWCADFSKAPCGTTACLAGEAIICSAPTVAEGVAELKRLDADLDDNNAVARRAAEMLGLEGSVDEWIDQRERKVGNETLIFDGNAEGWPEEFRERFTSADDGKERAAAAVGYLDKIIATGSVL